MHYLKRDWYCGVLVGFDEAIMKCAYARPVRKARVIAVTILCNAMLHLI